MQPSPARRDIEFRRTSRPPRTALFTRVRRETVRKGTEQCSEGGFGCHEEGEMGRKVPSRWSIGLRLGRRQDFSDSLRKAKFCEVQGSKLALSPQSYPPWTGPRPLLAPFRGGGSRTRGEDSLRAIAT